MAFPSNADARALRWLSVALAVFSSAYAVWYLKNDRFDWILLPAGVLAVYALSGAPGRRDRRRAVEVARWHDTTRKRRPESAQKAGYRDRPTSKKGAGAKRVVHLPADLEAALGAAHAGNKLEAFEVHKGVLYLATLASNAVVSSEAQAVVFRLPKKAPKLTVEPLVLDASSREMPQGIHLPGAPGFNATFLVRGDDPARVVKFLAPLAALLLELPDAHFRVEGKVAVLANLGPAHADVLAKLVDVARRISPPEPLTELPAAGTPPPPSATAWEDGEGGLFSRFVTTSKEALAMPGRFAERAMSRADVAPAATYAALASGLAGLAVAVLTALYLNDSLPDGPILSTERPIAQHLGDRVFAVAALPLLALGWGYFGTFLLGGITHATLRALNAARAPYESSARAAGFAGAASLLAPIPVVNLVGAALGVALCSSGLRAAHRCGAGKALVASLVGFLGCLLLAVGLVYLALTQGTGGLASTGLPFFDKLLPPR